MEQSHANILIDDHFISTNTSGFLREVCDRQNPLRAYQEVRHPPAESEVYSDCEPHGNNILLVFGVSKIVNMKLIQFGIIIKE